MICDGYRRHHCWLLNLALNKFLKETKYEICFTVFMSTYSTPNSYLIDFKKKSVLDIGQQLVKNTAL